MSEWQPIRGYETSYEVSRDGLVRTVSGKSVGQWPNDQGYMYVRLSHPRAMKRVHRLVAESFLSNPRGLKCVNHKDFVRSNNSASNLEWCTQSDNIAHSDRHNRMERSYWLGKRSPNAKLTDEQASAIRSDYATGSISLERLGKKHGMSRRAVGRIVNGETYV